jgi:transposase
VSKLTEAQKDQLIVALVDQVNVLLEQVATLTAQVTSLTARVEQLTAQARKNSSNSSKPPSSGGLGKKTRSLRESSGKKPGGQAGRDGTTLRHAEPTEIVTHPLPRQCERCHAAPPLEPARPWSRRQLIDVPVVPFEVVEHRTLAVTCQCGQLHASAFPAGVDNAVQYGPNVKALAVHLTQGQLLPFARAADLIADLPQPQGVLVHDC